jgi:hypothetical protein
LKAEIALLSNIPVPTHPGKFVNLNFLGEWKTTSIFLGKWNATSILKATGRQLQCFGHMEDNLNIPVNGRLPQF